MGGNASGSTLRFSLGTLVPKTLGIRLKQVRKRLHFDKGEEKLSD